MAEAAPRRRARTRPKAARAVAARPRAPARPHVTLKAAVTLDGRIATRTGDSKWITGEPARREAHRMRKQSDAVLVGVGTVLADDPELTVRHVRGRSPLRVVLDARLRTPVRARIAQTDVAPTLIFHARDASVRKARALSARGVELHAVAVDRTGRLSLAQVLRALARRGVGRLLVEGGSRVHGAFLDAGLADEAAVFVAPRLLADPEALPLAWGKPRRRIADAWVLAEPRTRSLGQDVLIRGRLVRA